MIEPALPPGARIVRRGSIRLDRRRAQEKIARFQLEDPRAYLLELIAAGVCAGAREIELRTGPRDLEITWDGEAPTRPELADLFDWVFTPVQSRRARMLQHLAQGIYGARGLRPAAIVLDVPGLRVDLTDPLQPGFSEGDHEGGVRLVVRERFELVKHSVGVVGWVFGQAQELRLLRQRASLCPTPIRLGRGQTVGVAHLALPNASKFHHVTDDAFLWIEVFDPDGTRLSDRYPTLLGRRTTVAIIRDGITIAEHEARLGDAALCGWIHADELQLDVSQARVAEDARWLALVAQLASIREQLVARLDQPTRAPGPRPAALAPQRRLVFAAAEAAAARAAEEERAAVHRETPVDEAAIAIDRADATEVDASVPAVELASAPTGTSDAPPPALAQDEPGSPDSPLEALRAELAGLCAVAVDRPTYERTVEALLRDLPRLGVAFLRDPGGAARVLLAWQIADRVLLAGDDPARAVEMAARVGHALAESIAQAGARRP